MLFNDLLMFFANNQLGCIMETKSTLCKSIFMVALYNTRIRRKLYFGNPFKNHFIPCRIVLYLFIFGSHTNYKNMAKLTEYRNGQIFVRILL